jgi:hypothetical protein
MPGRRKNVHDSKTLLDFLRRLLGDKPLGEKPPQLPGDPYADRMAPVRRGPKGRSGAAAVAEPDEDSFERFRLADNWPRHSILFSAGVVSPGAKPPVASVTKSRFHARPLH